jgi:hypothetical protein
MPEETPQRSRESVEGELAVKAWKDEAFMKALKADPKAVINKEYGVKIPDNVNVEVIEETASKLYLRLPPNPADLELSDEQLEAVAGGECVVTTTIVSGIIAGTFAVTVASIQVTERQTERRGW